MQGRGKKSRLNSSSAYHGDVDEEGGGQASEDVGAKEREEHFEAGQASGPGMPYPTPKGERAPKRCFAQEARLDPRRVIIGDEEDEDEEEDEQGGGNEGLAMGSSGKEGGRLLAADDAMMSEGGDSLPPSGANALDGADKGAEAEAPSVPQQQPRGFAFYAEQMRTQEAERAAKVERLALEASLRRMQQAAERQRQREDEARRRLEEEERRRAAEEAMAAHRELPGVVEEEGVAGARSVPDASKNAVAAAGCLEQLSEKVIEVAEPGTMSDEAGQGGGRGRQGGGGVSGSGAKSGGRKPAVSGGSGRKGASPKVPTSAASEGEETAHLLSPDDRAYADLEPADVDPDPEDSDGELIAELEAAGRRPPINTLEEHRLYEEQYKERHNSYFRLAPYQRAFAEMQHLAAARQTLRFNDNVWRVMHPF